jgi:hypothetical protein
MHWIASLSHRRCTLASVLLAACGSGRAVMALTPTAVPPPVQASSSPGPGPVGGGMPALACPVGGCQGMSDAQLDTLCSSPDFEGLVRGVVGSAVAARAGNAIVTDYQFAVEAVHGSAKSAYPAGRSITLRVPGGCVGDLCLAAEGAPQISSGAEVEVFVSQIGVNPSASGGDVAPSLVASSSPDVLPISHGQVQLSDGTAEPVADFERHFAAC